MLIYHGPVDPRDRRTHRVPLHVVDVEMRLRDRFETWLCQLMERRSDMEQDPYYKSFVVAVVVAAGMLAVHELREFAGWLVARIG